MSGKKSHDDDHLDFNKIEKEVQSAVISEEKYWRENDAKIRAVEQRVPSYDDFRDMVLAAHLQPLEKGDKISDMGAFTQVWNQAVQQKPAKSTDSGDDTCKMTNTNITVPKSGQDFAQTWRRLSKKAEDRRHFLLSISVDCYSNLFKTEISGGLLGEFFECLVDFEDSESGKVFGFLEVLSKSQRFSLSIAFLSKKEKTIGTSIFARLKQIRDTSSNLFPEERIDSESILKLEQLYQLQ